MTKIYTDHKTLEQDITKDQVNELNAKGMGEALTGATALVAANFAERFNIEKVLNSEKPSRGLGWVSTALNVVGFIEIVKSLFTVSKAHDRKHQLERMGPQEVVLLPEQHAMSAAMMDAGLGLGAPESAIGKSFTHTIQPTTLLEQAQKNADCSYGKNI